ncbi:MAG: DoxX family protein [Actinomycetota bacterium]
MNARTIARTLLAGFFIVGGLEALQNPKAKAHPVGEIEASLAAKAGLPSDPVDLARINGAVQLGGGLMLAAGWLPRLAATALAAVLVPNTLAAHRFWAISDPEERRRQLIHTLKSGSILGGLIMTALSQGGRPSVFWMTRKAADRAGDAVTKSMERVRG